MEFHFWLIAGIILYFSYELAFEVRAENESRISLAPIVFKNAPRILLVLVYRYLFAWGLGTMLSFYQLVPPFFEKKTLLIILLGVFPGLISIIASGFLIPRFSEIFGTIVKDLIYFVFYRTKRIILHEITIQERQADQEIINKYAKKQHYIHLFFESQKANIVKYKMEKELRLTYDKMKSIMGILKIRGALSTKNYLLMRYFGLEEYKKKLKKFNPSGVARRKKDTRKIGERRKNEKLP